MLFDDADHYSSNALSIVVLGVVVIEDVFELDWLQRDSDEQRESVNVDEQRELKDVDELTELHAAMVCVYFVVIGFVAID